jgi:hypothetical protein
MVGIVVVLAAFVSIAVFGIADEPGEQAPTVSLDTEFRAVSEVDPHWQLEVIHDGGDPVPSDELLVRFVDDSGSQAEVRYPERFDAGERFRTALWGKSGRADTSTCLVDPESDHPDSDQLDGFKTADEFATSVDVLVIHEPSNTVLSEERIDLGEEPDRFTGKTSSTGSSPLSAVPRLTRATGDEGGDRAGAQGRSTPVISNRAPPAALSVTATSQPWASATLLTILRPIPVPSGFVEWPVSNSRDRWSAGRPTPSSAT